MELKTKHGECFMANRHDFFLAVGHDAPRGNLEITWQRVGFDHQAVIARGDEWVGHAFKQALTIVINLVRFAVHEAFCSDNRSTECLPHRLMAEAYAEDRQLLSEVLDGLDGDSRFIWRARSGGNDQMGRFQLFDRGTIDLIVSVNL